MLPCGWLPLDIDTFAMDNSGTAKEGVGRTYAGVDGYCPLAAYLGAHGFCLDLALRPGVQHSACKTPYNFERIVPMAQRLSAAGPKAPLLARLDSGFDSAALMQCIESYERAGPAAGRLDHQVEPAQDRRRADGRRTRRCRHGLGAPASGQARGDLGGDACASRACGDRCAGCCG